MRKLFLLPLFAFLFSVSANAQQVHPANSARIYNELCQLNHLANVLYLAAHPDDENTRLLAWLVNDRHIHTAYLSLTRGDGGQNILGSEQGPALGLIRTHELLEARNIDGAEQYFTRAIDFGFSKNYQETFKHWNKYMLTSDVVWVIRKFRPDVIICRFPPDTRAGHGQHAASAILAEEAFKVAGDKLQFTEQLHYYPAWQPKRLLFNSFRFGDRNTTSENQFKLSVGQYLPEMGMGSGELAGLSRSVHKSQGAGTPMVPGVQTEYFKLVAGDTLTSSLFDGIDITWNRVNRADIGDDVKKAINEFDPLHPDHSLPALLAIRQKIKQVEDPYWKKEKLKEVNKLILDCSGFLAELYTNKPEAVAGTYMNFTLHIIARSQAPVKFVSIKFPGTEHVPDMEVKKGQPHQIDTMIISKVAKKMDTSFNAQISGDTLLTYQFPITIPSNAQITEPYWLSTPSAIHDLYNVREDTLLGLPETPDDLNAVVTLKIDGENLKVNVPLSYKKLDPVKGDVVEQLRIVPEATVEFTTNLLITKPDGSASTELRLHTNVAMNDAMLKVSNDNNIDILNLKGMNLPASADTIIPVNISATLCSKISDGDYYLKVAFGTMSRVYVSTQHLIQYNHIPTLQYFNDAYAKVLRSNWKCTAKRIGYIEGAGDYIPTFLRLAGLEVDVLKDGDFTDAAKLKKYDAIITGVRAVNVNKRMPLWLPVLMQYVQNGGTLVMQYNTLQDLSTTKVGPYPLTLTDSRVTEEDAKVNFTGANSRLLNYPNKITDKDFEGWVQERGLYFASKWDEHYKPLFEMNDNGEQPLQGGTLYTKYGKGNYIYTSLSFFRQLPAGNKGAVRLLMNMLSASK